MDDLSAFLAKHDFKTLFIEALGWDHASAACDVAMDDRQFHFEQIAHKRGFQILHCAADKYTLFNRGRLRSLQKQLLKIAHEHVVIYSCEEPRKQVWQWAVRLSDGRRLRHREHSFFSAAAPDPLVGRLRQIRFSLHEEEQVTLVDALDRVRAALDTVADQNLFVNKPGYAERSDQLAMAMQNGDSAAFHRFVEFHLAMARWGAKKWRRYFNGVEEEDRAQIATIGLLQAALRFEPAHGYQFSTYAYHWVRQACQRFGPKDSQLIRVPPHALWKCFSIRVRVNRLISRGESDAVVSLLEHLHDRSPQLAEYWRRYCIATSVRSLSDPHEPEYAASRLLPEAIGDPASPLQQHDLATAIAASIETLPPNDARMIRLRYGFDGEPQTLEEIAQIAGLTRERIRQRLKGAEDRLRPVVAKKLGMPLTAPKEDSIADPDDENAEANGDSALSLAERALLSEITGQPSGISAIDIACRLDVPRNARRGALRSLVESGRIVQNGVGRKAVYRPAKHRSRL